MVSAIQNCKGTAWIAKDSGELVKFDIDAEFQGSAGQSWNEHYEGLVTPKGNHGVICCLENTPVKVFVERNNALAAKVAKGALARGL